MSTIQLQFSSIVMVGNITGRFWIVDGAKREMHERNGKPTFGFEACPACNAADYILHEGAAVIVNGLEYRISTMGNEIILV